MKGVYFCGVFLLWVGSVLGNAQQISQDSIELNLGTGELLFNDEPLSLDKLGGRVGDSYSVAVNIWAESQENRFPTYSPASIISVLETIKGAGVATNMIRISALTVPIRDDSVLTDRVCFNSENSMFVNGQQVALDQVESSLFKKKRITIWSDNFHKAVGFGAFLNGLKALPDEVSIGGMRCEIRSGVEISAHIFTIDKDGKEDVLSAPKVTTKAGNEAVLRVVQNASGYKSNEFVNDKYHQEDLANLGSRLRVTLQVIGDDLLVSGVTILTKMNERQPVFMDGSVPVASYTCSKIVVPFSFVFKSDVDTVEFDIADIDGKPAKCKLSAQIVDDKGMNRKQREASRRGAIGSPPSH